VFNYDGEEHFAKLVSLRSNYSVRFEFFDPAMPEEEDKSYLEFRMDENELTQTLFLKVIDYSNGYDEDEQESIWDSLINKLKEMIGG